MVFQVAKEIFIALLTHLRTRDSPKTKAKPPAQGMMAARPRLGRPRKEPKMDLPECLLFSDSMTCAFEGVGVKPSWLSGHSLSISG